MKPHTIALALIVTLGPSLALAQGGGGGGGSGGSGGGASAGSGSAAGSPAAGSAGAGTLGTNGIPPGPANSAGLNNSGNDPSGSGNNRNFGSGTTTGLANPAPATSPNGGQSASVPPRGTNSAGTAAASGGGSMRANGARKPTTQDRDADATINAENQKLDRTVKSICRGC